MLNRAEYSEFRTRNRTEFSEGATELRDALVAIPPAERARLISDSPQILARLPTAALRAEVLLVGTDISPIGQRAVMSALVAPEASVKRAAEATTALLPWVSPSADTRVPPKRSCSSSGIISARRRVTNRWMRFWIGLGRPVQATALVLVATVGINAWFVGKAATAHDVLPPSAVFHLAGTWPTCSDGLRPRTDFCVYPVQKSLDWRHAMADLRATAEEQKFLMIVNKPLLETNALWPPDTLLVVWRGIKPESIR